MPRPRFEKQLIETKHTSIQSFGIKTGTYNTDLERQTSLETTSLLVNMAYSE